MLYEERTIAAFLKNNKQFFILSLSDGNTVFGENSETIKEILEKTEIAGGFDKATADEFSKRLAGIKRVEKDK